MISSARGVARVLLFSLPLSVPVNSLAQTPSGPPPIAPVARQEPIGRFVVDARGALPIFTGAPSIAPSRELPESALPGFGLGLDVGAHVYPLRVGVVTFGIGASVLVGRGTKTLKPAEGETVAAAPPVTSKVSAFSPQVSFNFGARDGWSYISGGIGRATLAVSRDDRPGEEGEATKTINYGGGARWFLNDRVAFTIDGRFYAMNPVEATELTAGHARLTLFVLSVGVSFK
jgi:hypothetical protein